MSLEITVGSGGGGSWENPPTGIHKATCCDVVDLGKQETKHGNKHQCEIHFELAKDKAGVVEATGKQFTVRTQRYSLPEPGHELHEKSNLHQFLSGWRGKTLEPGDNIKLEQLIGVHAHLSLSMKKSQKGTEYTAITSASPKGKDEVFPPLSGAYTRRQDRVEAPQQQQPATAPTGVPATPLADDDMPF